MTNFFHLITPGRRSRVRRLALVAGVVLASLLPLLAGLRAALVVFCTLLLLGWLASAVEQEAAAGVGHILRWLGIRRRRACLDQAGGQEPRRSLVLVS